MYCSRCGTQNEESSATCVRCGDGLQNFQYVGTGAQGQKKVSNYLVQAILATIFCCLPFGIAAIVFAAQVNGKLASGDYAGAVETSRKAKIWCWLSFGVGLGFVIIFGIIGFFAGLAGNSLE